MLNSTIGGYCNFVMLKYEYDESFCAAKSKYLITVLYCMLCCIIVMRVCFNIENVVNWITFMDTYVVKGNST